MSVRQLFRRHQNQEIGRPWKSREVLRLTHELGLVALAAPTGSAHRKLSKRIGV